MRIRHTYIDFTIMQAYIYKGFNYAGKNRMILPKRCINLCHQAHSILIRLFDNLCHSSGVINIFLVRQKLIFPFPDVFEEK